MNDENWKKEFMELKTNLKPYQIKLLEEGPQSNSQTLMLSDMWLEWKDLVAKREINKIGKYLDIDDPWEGKKQTCSLNRSGIDEQFLQFVQPWH